MVLAGGWQRVGWEHICETPGAAPALRGVPVPLGLLSAPQDTAPPEGCWNCERPVRSNQYTAKEMAKR